jgi:hypothetical protein
MRIVAFIFSFGPVFFGIGFIAPLIAALLSLAKITPPFGLSGIQFGLIIGVIAGSIAMRRRTWIW